MDIMEKPDFENIQPKVETDWSSKSCFICLNDTSTDKEHHHERRKGNQLNSTSSVKILTCYILQNSISSSRNKNREELQKDIVSCFNNGDLSICSECLSKAENLLELHLELEKVQMQILDVLRNLQDYLKSSLGRNSHEADDSILLASFQEVLVQEFLFRELMDGMELRLNRLTNAGYTQVPSSHLDIFDNSIQEDPLGESFNEDEDTDSLDNGDGPPVHINPDHDEDDLDIKPTNENTDILLPSIQSQLWDCDICLMDIPYKEMEAHLKTHPEFEKYYTCDLCPPTLRTRKKKIFGTYKGLIWHYLRRVHRVQMPCIFCPDSNKRILFKAKDLCRHLYEIHHPSHKKLPCKDVGCPEEFYDHISRRNHCKKMHLERPSPEVKVTIETEAPDPDFEPVIGKGRVWECDICLESIPSKGLSDHLQSHPEFEQLYRCTICPPFSLPSRRLFGTYKGLIWHYIKCKHRIQVPCNLCPADQGQNNLLFETKDLCKHLYEIHHPNHRKLPCKEKGCPEEFYEHVSQRIHYRKVHTSEIPSLVKVKCPHCQKLMRRHYLAIHIGRKHNIKTFTCDKCEKVFQRKFSFDAHIQRQRCKVKVKKKAEVKSYSCPKCLKLFKTRKGFKRHEDYGHNENPEMVSCPHCPKIFKKHRLQQHISYAHNEIKTTKTKSKEVKLRQPPPPRLPQKLKCPHCPKDIIRLYLPVHIEKKHSEKLLKPPLAIKEKIFTYTSCPRTFKKKHSLQVHEQAWHKEKKCSQCPFTSSSNAALKAHFKVHRIFTCQYCAKTFRANQDLKNHERIHTKEKPFKCRVTEVFCEMTFHSQAARSSHERKKHGISKRPLKTNVEEKVYLCNSCPKTFKKDLSLRHHQENIHGKPKLYKCPQCPKLFRKHRINYHIQWVHGDKVLHCQFCPKTFTRRNALNWHEDIHKNERKYKCTECEYAANIPSNLRAHKQNIHRKKKLEGVKETNPNAVSKPKPTSWSRSDEEETQ